MITIGEMRIEAKGLATGLDFFRPFAPIQELTVGGVPVTAQPHAQYPEYLFHIEYPTPLMLGDLAEFKIILQGTPRCASSEISGAVACLRTSTETVLTPNSVDASWYLMNLYELDPFIGEITVKAPSAQTVVAGQGPPLEVIEDEGGFKTWQFRYREPTENLGVYAGEVAIVRSANGFPVAGYFRDRDDHRARMLRAVELASLVIPLYGELYGAMPLTEGSLVAVPSIFPFGGLGLLGTVFFVDAVIGSHDYLLEQGVAHELGHTWWGGIGGASDATEVAFFNESFAEYSAWRALGAIKGEDVRTSGIRMNTLWYIARRPSGEDIAVLDPEARSSPAFVHATYHKGSSFLRTMEEAVGQVALTEALRAMLSRGFGELSVDGFIEDIRMTSGYDATRDVDQWLRATGFPRITASSRTIPVDTDARAPQVELSIHSTGDFDYLLPVYFTLTDGTRSKETVRVHAGDNVARFTVASSPSLIEIDPDWTLVREMKPERAEDVTFDGEVDAADLIEVSLRSGGMLPTVCRVDGRYDPLYDVDGDQRIDDADLIAIRRAAEAGGRGS